MANGTEVKLDIANEDAEFMGEIGDRTITFGDAEAEPLLRITSLKSVDIIVNQTDKRISWLSSVRLYNMEYL